MSTGAQKEGKKSGGGSGTVKLTNLAFLKQFAAQASLKDEEGQDEGEAEGQENGEQQREDGQEEEEIKEPVEMI